jgi:hypothetical protein
MTGTSGTGGAAGANVAFVLADDQAGLAGIIPITKGGNVGLCADGDWHRTGAYRTSWNLKP